MPPSRPKTAAARENAQKWKARQDEAISLFLLFDHNGDGGLSRDELGECLFQCFPTACAPCLRCVAL
eukprot:5489722-Prymnesium_polylepis.1